MLIYDERSRNVYENKQHKDKMPDEKHGFYVTTTWILQKFAACDGNLRVNDITNRKITQYWISLWQDQRITKSLNHQIT